MPSQIDVTKPITGSPTTQSVRDNFTTTRNEISALQTQTTGAPFLSLAGGRMTAPMYLFNDPTDAMMPATRGYVDAHSGGGGGGIPEPISDGKTYGRNSGAWQLVLPIAGGTLTGPLILAADPVAGAPLGAATKQYVDAVKAAVPPEALSDGTTYGRRNAAWVNVLPLTGGVTTGSVGVNVTIPTSPAPSVPTLLAGSASAGEVWINAYRTGTNGYNLIKAGSAGVLINDPALGNLYIGAGAAGTAGSAVTFNRSMVIDSVGTLRLTAGNVIPTDTLNPTFSAVEFAATSLGHYAFNMYLATGGVWKYLADGGAGSLFQDASGNLSIVVANAGSASGNVGAFAAAYVFGRNGNFTAPGGIAGTQVTTSNAIYPSTTNAPTWNLFADATNNYVNFASGNYFVYGRANGDLTYYIGATASLSIRNSDKLLWNGAAAVGGVGAYVVLSDRRGKSEIDTMRHGLAEILRLEPVSFIRIPQFAEASGPPRRELGFVAQDVLKVIPEAVTLAGITLPDGTGKLDDDEPSLGLTSDSILAVTVAAIQELTARVVALEGGPK